MSVRFKNDNLKMRRDSTVISAAHLNLAKMKEKSFVSPD